jgi:hypothetical protein
VFVPPRNGIGADGLRAIEREGLHLGGVAGMRSGWRRCSTRSWASWLRLRRWRSRGGAGLPWVLDLGRHREIAGYPVTPTARIEYNRAVLESTLASGGVFCAATHYWEHPVPSLHPGAPPVGEHLRQLVDRAVSDPRVVWRSVGDVVSNTCFVA